MKDISKDILKNIKEQGLAPKPRWHFLLKRASIWTIFAISIVLGSIAIGVIILQFTYADWDIQTRLGRGTAGFLLLVMPYFWLIFFSLFSFLAYHYFRLTDGGYKYASTYIVLGSLFLSIIGGSVFYWTGLSDRMERVFQDRLPFYERLHLPRQELWKAPERGLLGGRILKILNQDRMMIIDLGGKEWRVDIGEAKKPPRMKLDEGMMIKIIGDKIDEERFRAEEIRPWIPLRNREVIPDKQESFLDEAPKRI